MSKNGFPDDFKIVTPPEFTEARKFPIIHAVEQTVYHYVLTRGHGDYPKFIAMNPITARKLFDEVSSIGGFYIDTVKTFRGAKIIRSLDLDETEIKAFT